ncbi:MAG: hypothetical protein LC649_05670 [Bacteroidales bacterium]|nr:hypothetical protein [Bacteroidales bacterium]
MYYINRLSLLLLLSIAPCTIAEAIPHLKLSMVEGTTADSGKAGGVNYEQVYIHTDRTIYIAGEDIWFSLYLLDGNNNPEGKRSRVAYIEVVSSSNIPVANIRSGINSGIASGSISLPDTISTGLYYIRAYTNFMKNFGPESYYHQDVVVYNPFRDKEKNPDILQYSKLPSGKERSPYNHLRENKAAGISSLFVGESFTPREKVTVEVNLDSNVYENPNLTNLSISVAVAAAGPRQPHMSQYVSRSSREKPENEAETDFKYPREAYGPFLEGTIVSRENLTPGSELLLYLSTPSSIPQINYSFSDSLGNFRFYLKPEEGIRDIFIQPADLGHNWLIKVNTPFSGEYIKTRPGEFPLDPGLIENAVKMGINYQLNKIYKEFAPAVTGNDLNNSRVRFYGKPDIELILADYIALPSMEEVFHELTPGVSLRRQRTGLNLVFADDITGQKFENPDIIMVDGVLINDPGAIASLDPGSVEKIDIIKGKYQTGSIVFNGIVSIILREGEVNGPDLAPAGMRTQYIPVDETLCPGHISYGEGRPYDTPVPDFRNTLFFGSRINPSKDGSVRFDFFTSDYCADYIITIKGITDTGIPVSWSKIITVELEHTGDSR